MVRMTNELSKDFFKNWEINASLQGPTKGYGKKVDSEKILPSPEEKGSIVLKYQKCGKKCTTCTEGKGHGPYQWRVVYVGMVDGKKKYRWNP